MSAVKQATHPLDPSIVLAQPDPAPLRKLALFDRDQPCAEHQVAFMGKIPCTGLLGCSICGTRWDPKDGKLIP